MASRRTEPCGLFISLFKKWTLDDKERNFTTNLPASIFSQRKGHFSICFNTNECPDWETHHGWLSVLRLEAAPWGQSHSAQTSGSSDGFSGTSQNQTTGSLIVRGLWRIVKSLLQDNEAYKHRRECVCVWVKLPGLLEDQINVCYTFCSSFGSDVRGISAPRLSRLHDLKGQIDFLVSFMPPVCNFPSPALPGKANSRLTKVHE